MKSNYALAIQGSPRKDGITSVMLEKAIAEAKKKGYTVEKIDLYEQDIHYCKGCRSCLDTGKCVQKDDLQKLVEAVKQSKLVILASPVYWANVPAAVKNLFDRMLGVAMEETVAFPKPRLEGRKYMILTACNTKAPFSWIFGQSRGAIHCMDEFFRTAGMRPLGKVVCTGTGSKKKPDIHTLKKIERCFR